MVYDMRKLRVIKGFTIPESGFLASDLKKLISSLICRPLSCNGPMKICLKQMT